MKRRSKTQRRPSSHLPFRPPIDGAAMRAALQRYGRGEITVEALLDELRSLNVHGNAAAAMARAFRPRAEGAHAS
jgi:hypothetical protein